MYDQATQERLAILRQKTADNTITKEELTEAIVLMRQGRVAASATSAKAKATKSVATAKKNIDSNDLLSELDGLAGGSPL